tara:strand:- start:116 stop:448 length:333 start_codon:yes stop_codon:yes gene_type:complete
MILLLEHTGYAAAINRDSSTFSCPDSETVSIRMDNRSNQTTVGDNLITLLHTLNHLFVPLSLLHLRTDQKEIEDWDNECEVEHHTEAEVLIRRSLHQQRYRRHEAFPSFL